MRLASLWSVSARGWGTRPAPCGIISSPRVSSCVTRMAGLDELASTRAPAPCGARRCAGNQRASRSKRWFALRTTGLPQSDHGKNDETPSSDAWGADATDRPNREIEQVSLLGAVGVRSPLGAAYLESDGLIRLPGTATWMMWRGSRSPSMSNAVCPISDLICGGGPVGSNALCRSATRNPMRTSLPW